MSKKRLKERWKQHCQALFGSDWNISVEFKDFYSSFLKAIDEEYK
jgi:hypothetical protein